ncbi:GPI mannosyltransferase 3 [[Candida] jaroonii]|uniref:GPI mannosyltransferase 3 n=1 Tax=[Candida] jaroonii TaxID=467808 RepID=A0ACA9Y197_9ASCO|nr:GPI mannosyltransferase 3 [[Candida] jaroonii]
MEWVFAVVLAIRLVNVFTLKTFFQPDEFYQSLEVAHRLIFGYGYETWEWKEGLRSSLHPLIYAVGYYLTRYLGENWVYVGPKVINAVLAAIGETYMYIFATRYSNNRQIGKITLMLSIFNPFNWYVITRSFSNNLEMILTCIALAYWPWRSRKPIYLSCFFAFLSCIIRPTTAIIWLILGIYHLTGLKGQEIFKTSAILMVELSGLLGVETLCNYKFYGYWTFPLYNFIQFNIIKKLSIFYGSSPWHFHIFQSLPIILMIYLPFFLHAVYKFKTYKQILGITCMGTITVFSMVSHKEFRFIYPLMPILLLITAQSVNFLINTNKIGKKVMVCLTVINLFISYFFSQINEKGVIEVIDYLGETNENFGLLMPCHSTPWQSQLHDETFESSWFITCEPPLHLKSSDDINAYRDESDQLFDNPSLFIQKNFPYSINDPQGNFKYEWPQRLVIFEAFDEIKPILEHKGYQPCKTFFNSYFHWDDRRRGDLIIYCKPTSY